MCQAACKIVLIPLLWFSLSCAVNTLVRQRDLPTHTRITQTHHIALFGFWELSPPIALDRVCGDGQWSKIVTGFSALNVGVGLLTAGLYTPATVEISCQAREIQSRR